MLAEFQSRASTLEGLHHTRAFLSHAIEYNDAVAYLQAQNAPQIVGLVVVNR
jgi:hypothetical protein